MARARKRRGVDNPHLFQAGSGRPIQVPAVFAQRRPNGVGCRDRNHRKETAVSKHELIGAVAVATVRGKAFRHAVTTWW